MSKSNPLYLSVDEYIEQALSGLRERLSVIRKTIRETAPDAAESIHYDMPAYHMNGKPLIYFAAQKKHIAIHPGTETVAAFTDKLAGYVCTKGGIQFPHDKQVPYELIREIVGYKAEAISKLVGVQE